MIENLVERTEWKKNHKTKPRDEVQQGSLLLAPPGSPGPGPDVLDDEVRYRAGRRKDGLKGAWSR